MPSRKLLVALLLAGALLTACNSHDESFFISKQWQGWSLRLETRPHPVQAGHNEFLLHVVSPDRHLPRGMIVQYRMTPGDEWIQAMPDGLSDIFRRALTVKDPAHAKLYVHLKYRNAEGDVVFDLSARGAGS